MPNWVFNLKPTPASRPRIGRYGTYYGKNYTKFRRDAETEIPRVLGKKHKIYPAGQALEVKVTVLVTRPKSSEKDWPRGDVDNYAKGILDACNGVLWEDDDSIVHLTTVKIWTLGPPLILLSVKALTAKQQANLLARSADSVDPTVQETT